MFIVTKQSDEEKQKSIHLLKEDFLSVELKKLALSGSTSYHITPSYYLNIAQEWTFTKGAFLSSASQYNWNLKCIF